MSANNPPLTAYVDYPSASGTVTGPFVDVYGVMRLSQDPGSNIPGILSVSGGSQNISASNTNAPLQVTNSGGLAISASGSAGGLAVTGGATIDQLFGGVANPVVSITANAWTILSGKRVERYIASGTAYTGAILTPGSTDGQTVIVTNENVSAGSANTIAFAAVATSNVLNGALCVISGGAYKQFVWCASLSGGTGGTWVPN